MLNIQELLIQSMKNNLYETVELNQATRRVLSELKTKLKDIREEITTEIQYKLLEKFKKDRENLVQVYQEAYDKTKSEIALKNLETAKEELTPIVFFLGVLETDMPQKLTESEIQELINNIINNFRKNENRIPNVGELMRELKTYTKDNIIDMKLASMLAKNSLQ